MCRGSNVCAMVKPDYGLDAPGVVRNLLLVAVAAVVVAVALCGGFWTPHSKLAPALFAVIGTGAGCLPMAIWMIWYSKVGKIRGRDRVLNGLALRGDETVLDVGCGR